MKIMLCSSYVPFMEGGYRAIVRNLEHALRQRNHAVDTIWIPEDLSSEDHVANAVAYRFIDCSSAQKIVTFRPQSHLIQHESKVVWFIHHLREYFDLWGTAFGAPSNDRNRAIRNIVRGYDETALREAVGVFSNSELTAQRLMQFNAVRSEVLYPPLPEASGAIASSLERPSYGDYFYSPCRIERHKRIDLLVRAIHACGGRAKLLVTGPSGDPGYVRELRELISKLGVDDQVSIIDKFIPEDEKHRHLNKCRAVVYAPFAEDSYGFPSLEAALYGKPVVTASDSGGTLEIVGAETGMVCEPSADAMAAAFSLLMKDASLAQDLGQSLASHCNKTVPSWDRVVEALIQ